MVDLGCDKKEEKVQIITTDPLGYLEVYFKFLNRQELPTYIFAIALWSEIILYMITILLMFVGICLWPSVYLTLVNVPWALKKNI